MVSARRIAAVAAAALALVAAPRRAAAHPLHTTMTELVEDRARGTVRATVRVFADDFGVAVRRAARGRTVPTSGPAWDASALAYVTAGFRLSDGAGRAVALRSCGVRRTGDVLWICLEATPPAPLATLHASNTLLCGASTPTR